MNANSSDSENADAPRSVWSWPSAAIPADHIVALAATDLKRTPKLPGVFIGGREVLFIKPKGANRYHGYPKTGTTNDIPTATNEGE